MIVGCNISKSDCEKNTTFEVTTVFTVEEIRGLGS
jgi:hypothetical protein